MAVIPYLHGVSHNLRRIANKASIQVCFSAPKKLSALRSMNHDSGREKSSCQIKHRAPFVDCADAVVYDLPLNCGKKYIGQTGRCLNDRLWEHDNNVKTKAAGHLSTHCDTCGCEPQFEDCRNIGRNSITLTREIIEAAEIERLGETCISVASIALTKK